MLAFKNSIPTYPFKKPTGYIHVCLWYFTDYKILLFVTLLCVPLRKEKILQLNYDNNLL